MSQSDRYLVNVCLLGTGNAFMREPGRVGPGSSATSQTAAVVLLSRRSKQLGQQLELVLQFDCGLGTTHALIQAGIPRINALFLSHNHNDHFLEADRLFQGLARTGSSQIPCYCTEGTWNRSIGAFFAYLPNVDPQFVTPAGRPGTHARQVQFPSPSGGPELTVTPVAVFHGNPAIVPEPVIWVVEWAGTRIVFAWDLLHLASRYPWEEQFPAEAKRQEWQQQGWYTDIQTAEDSELLPEHEILCGADYLFIAGNTLEPHQQTGHTSITTIINEYVPRLRPRCAYVTHYSGWEDSMGPMSPEQLIRSMDDLRRARGVEQPVLLAKDGLWLSFPG